jgi:hypothetical protein
MDYERIVAFEKETYAKTNEKVLKGQAVTDGSGKKTDQQETTSTPPPTTLSRFSSYFSSSSNNGTEKKRVEEF